LKKKKKKIKINEKEGKKRNLKDLCHFS